MSKCAHHLRTWGEAGVVTVRDIKTSKLMDKGITCMFIGYCLDHAGDCYKMYNPQTDRYHITRDVKRLNRRCFKHVRFHTKEDLIKLKAGKSDK